MKECFKCKQSKPFSEFYKHKQMKDGYLNKCKSCAKSDVRKHRADNSDKVKAYEKMRNILQHRVKARNEYKKTPQGKRAMDDGRKAWNERWPIKRAAIVAVGNAVRSGKIIKPKSCSVCSHFGKLEAHHDDYSFPLIVRWLCVKCHKRWHKNNSPLHPEVSETL